MSDPLAEDYKSSLEDLINNDRSQILNLTMIASENIKQAEAISRVIVNHIYRTPPPRKLPALYVLDSIVKSVGSPYTVYFGRNLHGTFMYAYSQVGVDVRHKLEVMLATWRAPVPGSLTTTPVFPLSSTQKIVDDLSKLRNNSAPQPRYQQHPNQGPARSTPTPTYGALPGQTFQPTLPIPLQQQSFQSPTPDIRQQFPPAQHQRPETMYHDPQETQIQANQIHNSPAQPYRSPLPASHPLLHDVDMKRLHEDIDDLTTDAKIESATHPMDQAAQRKLSTLQTLKEILDSGNASPSDVVDIRNTINEQVGRKAAERNQHPQSNSQPPIALRPQFVPSPQLVPPTLAPPAQMEQPPTSMFNAVSLAELLRATTSQTSTPQPPSFLPGLQQPAQSSGTPLFSGPSITATPATENPLLAQLRASGFLSGSSTPPLISTPPNAPYATIAPIEMTFTSASIKIPRPQMVTSFLAARPNQCSTCGRRFTSDEMGRERKARHLDWHFRTKARMIEAEGRGQNRSWYVDEREWISSREYDDEPPEEAMNGSMAAAAAKKQQTDFVRAPSDPALRSLPCPIDQEPFKSEWSEEVQDFIWKDTVQVGGKYYHASCYREVTKDRDAGGLTPLGAGLRTATPDSVLGKRKAEQEANGVRSKLKVEAS